ncbi:bactofilin family protein [Chengkuizengella axinellae]|uniref:Polymer-forming cytoskeletal protein n=1 Tax=Chengkuizengella axinellae TaxID=3064388 RepID=A0ABT9J4Z4_9BACL|nr:polymer-forming cytoskeletal protein [Chengkuizengella sp. 2205SS18-9]MDP5276687.1 polymer-forming cytoskeletal protein [Chengkuizengella sp. 2205SS18-9]
MFKKSELDPNSIDTVIGKETTFEGELKTQASLRIEGQVSGDIHCTGDLTIGVDAIVQSNIKAKNVITSGIIRGTVHTNGLLSISKTGKVYGDISVGSIKVEEGGVFSGESKMEETKNITAIPTENMSEKQKEVKTIMHKIKQEKAKAQAVKHEQQVIQMDR